MIAFGQSVRSSSEKTREMAVSARILSPPVDTTYLLLPQVTCE
jgi:hypothetical protein